MGPVARASEIELARLGGFWEGEGCVMIELVDRSLRPRLVMAATQNPVGLDTLKEYMRFFGGSIGRHGDRCLDWRCYTHSAARALTLLLDYIGHKRPQVDCALDYYRSHYEVWRGEGRYVKWSESRLDTAMRYRKALQELKRKDKVTPWNGLDPKNKPKSTP